MKTISNILTLAALASSSISVYGETLLLDECLEYLSQEEADYQFVSDEASAYLPGILYVLDGEIKFTKKPIKDEIIEIDLLFENGMFVNVGYGKVNANSEISFENDSVILAEQGKAIIGLFVEGLGKEDIELVNISLVPYSKDSECDISISHGNGASGGALPSKSNPYGLTNSLSYVGNITNRESEDAENASIRRANANTAQNSVASIEDINFEEIAISYDKNGRITAYNGNSYEWDVEGNMTVSCVNSMNSMTSMTLEEWQAFDFFGENAQGGMNYLSAVANDGMLSSITPSQALSILQKLFDDYVFHNRLQWSGLLPAKGISFKRCTGVGSIDLNCLSGMTKEQFFEASGVSGVKLPAIEFDGTEDFSRRTSLDGTDLSKCTGLTAAQIMQVKVLRNAKLPAIAFAGTEDFTGKTMSGVDLSRCTGLTVLQVITMDAWTSVKFPAIVFAGTENFSGKSISGTDFSKCTGITLAQIKSASNVDGLKWPNVSFSPEDTLAGVRLWNADLSACTLISGAQILTASTLQYSIFPAITFTGNENFTGKNLLRVDISKTSGITSAQLMSAFTLNQLKVTSVQFHEYESALRAKAYGMVYIDGVLVKLE